jgi:hypothetical protein
MKWPAVLIVPPLLIAASLGRRESRTENNVRRSVSDSYPHGPRIRTDFALSIKEPTDELRRRLSRLPAASFRR